MVPGVINSVPAVCPNCACLPVLGELPGWKLLVFTATLRPFTEIDVSSRASRSDLRGLARDDLIFPNAFDPAFNTTVPLTATSWSTCAAKVLPTGSCEEMELAVLKLSVVPAGMVAAFKDDATKHAQTVAITVMNLYRVILIEWLIFQVRTKGTRGKELLRRFVRRLICCDRGGLHRLIDQLENNGCYNSGSEVGEQIDPDIAPTRNTKNADTQSDCGIECAA